MIVLMSQTENHHAKICLAEKGRVGHLRIEVVVEVFAVIWLFLDDVALVIFPLVVQHRLFIFVGVVVCVVPMRQVDVATEPLRTIIVVFLVLGVGAAPTLSIAISKKGKDRKFIMMINSISPQQVCQRIMHCPAQQEAVAKF